MIESVVTIRARILFLLVAVSAGALAQTPVCATVTAQQSTASIQQQIDNCAAKATSQVTVEFSASGGSDFTLGPLILPSNVLLWLDAGVTLHASTDPSVFQRTATSRTAACDSSSSTIPVCGTLDTTTTGCLSLINACNVTNAGVGGPGTIEGHGWSALTTGANAGTTWWGLATAAKQGNYAKSLNAPFILHFTGSTGITLSGFTIHNGPLVHIRFDKSSGIAVSQVTIATPTADHTIGSFPYNSDGMDFSGSSNVAVDRVDVMDGDDNIAFEGGGGGAVNNVSVTNSIFRAGHGLSIGSPTSSGVTGLTASNIYFTGTDNGLRIKSYAGAGGVVDQVQYSTVCITKVADPIVIDAYYSSASGTTLPQFQNVGIQGLYADGGSITLRAYAGQPPLNLTLNNVRIDSLKTVTTGNVNVSEISDPSFNFPPSIASSTTNAVTVTKTQAAAAAPADMKQFCAVGQGVAKSAGIASVASGANYSRGPVAADSIVSIFANAMAQSTTVASGTPLPTQLGNVSVTVTDSGGTQKPAELFAVTPGQVNAHVPAGLATGPGVMAITGASGATFWSPIQVATAAPGLFSADATGTGAAAAQVVTNHADGSQTSVLTFQCGQAGCAATPVSLGSGGETSALVLYATGVRNAAAGSVAVTIGNQTLTPFYVGQAPTWVGLDQVNVAVPASLAGQQNLSVSVTAGGVASNTVVVSFR